MLRSHLRNSILGGTTAIAVFLTASIATAQPLNLPTTEEWIGGFVQGGLQAADALSSVRGRPLGSGIRRPVMTGRSRFGRRTVNYSTPSYSGATYQSTYTSIPSNPLPTNSSPSVALLSTSAPPAWPYGTHIVNRPENQLPIRFVADGKSYTLQPGQRLEFAPGTARAIQFDRGGQFGTGVYGLTSSVFTFTPTAHGWELYSTPHQQPVVTSSSTTIQLPPPIPWPGG